MLLRLHPLKNFVNRRSKSVKINSNFAGLTFPFLKDEESDFIFLSGNRKKIVFL